LGIGLNEFRYLPEIKYNVSHAHNKFFHVAVELGIPALIAYLALLMLTGFMIVKTWRSKNTNAGRLIIVILGLGCGQLAHAIFEVTDVIPFGAKVGFFPWISLALIVAIYNHIIKVYEVPKVPKVN
jgi:O-antigen ligase